MKLILLRSRRWWPLATIFAAIFCTLVTFSSTSCAFVSNNYPQLVVLDVTLRSRHHPLSMAQDGNINEDSNNDSSKSYNSRNDTNQHVIISELSWRVTKARLEEANTKRLLSRKPLKLPYSLSQKWIQHNYAPKTKEEFERLVMDGDLKNVYISKRPEEYYGRRGEWISWDHYLLGECGEEEGRNGTVSVLKWQ